MHSRGKAIRTSYGWDIGDDVAAMNQGQHPGLGTHMLRTHFPISSSFCLSPTKFHELCIVSWEPGPSDNGVLTCPDKSLHHPRQSWGCQIVGDGGALSTTLMPSHHPTLQGREQNPKEPLQPNPRTSGPTSWHYSHLKMRSQREKMPPAPSPPAHLLNVHCPKPFMTSVL